MVRVVAELSSCHKCCGIELSPMGPLIFRLSLYITENSIRARSLLFSALCWADLTACFLPTDTTLENIDTEDLPEDGPLRLTTYSDWEDDWDPGSWVFGGSQMSPDSSHRNPIQNIQPDLVQQTAFRMKSWFPPWPTFFTYLLIKANAVLYFAEHICVSYFDIA